MALFEMPTLEGAFRALFLKKKDAPSADTPLTLDTALRGFTGFPHKGADRFVRSYPLLPLELALNILKGLFVLLPLAAGKLLQLLAEKLDVDIAPLVQSMGWAGYLAGGLALIPSGLAYIGSMLAYAGAFVGACTLASSDMIKESHKSGGILIATPVTILVVATQVAILIFSWPAYFGLFGLKLGTRLHEELQKGAHQKDAAEKVYQQVESGGVDSSSTPDAPSHGNQMQPPMHTDLHQASPASSSSSSSSSFTSSPRT